MYVEKRLKPTWDWILTVMDATEAQLRFGASLTDSADSAHPLHPHNTNSSTAPASSEYKLTFDWSDIHQHHFCFIFYFLFLFYKKKMSQ